MLPLVFYRIADVLMILAHYVKHPGFLPVPINPGESVPADAIWLDLVHPTPDEDQRVEKLTGKSIPTREEMAEIEESSRFYSEDGALYLTMPVLHGAATPEPALDPIVFILAGNRLISVRYSEPSPFKHFRARISKQDVPPADGLDVLVGLCESITDRIADLLENIAMRLDTESRRLFAQKGAKSQSASPVFRDALRLIGAEGEFLSMVRESLSGLARLLVFLKMNNKNAVKRAKIARAIDGIERDVQSLTAHSGYLSERTVFLLDAVVGLVSVEQNAIIKIFSVAAVVFMPPTLVASVYGMNFRHMPELEWLAGYPFAIGMMILAAVLPLAFFRYKGWL